MPISTVWILKYVQQCYVKWFWTISSLGALEFDSRCLLVKHFSLLSCGSATQLTISTLAQARAFSSASFCEFYNPQARDLTVCVIIICTALLLPCFLRSCCCFFLSKHHWFKIIVDCKSFERSDVKWPTDKITSWADFLCSVTNKLNWANVRGGRQYFLQELKTNDN